MILKDTASINGIAIHKVGNKLTEGLHLSKSAFQTNDELDGLFLDYFLTPFKKQEYFTFYHDSDLELNEVYTYACRVFDDPGSLYIQSVSLAKHLYEKSTHPKIKGGEFYTVYFKDCSLGGERVDALGLFKSENKDTFLKVFALGDGYEILSEQGINIHKLDKGCLIFNTEREKGFIVAVVDNTNKGDEAQYWIDDFLHIKQRKDEYYNTRNVLSLCKDFVTKELPQQFDVSKADQVDLLNKSVKFFKENESFDMKEFSTEVIENPEIIESFKRFKDSYQRDQDIDIAEHFDISDSAVKKQARVFKSVIKLDKNFHIYIHGNREMIEQGSDERGKYYKVYYKVEA
ncbi:MAG: nucleoid-associated protein [Bacteroidetes bacterium]|nr:nucleoid-associated protein [Bacteroidota bacterium]